MHSQAATVAFNFQLFSDRLLVLADLDLELIRCDEALAEIDWASKFGDMVQRESHSLSPTGRERAALAIQLAYRGMLERDAHAYDSDAFEFESEEEIDEEIEEGPQFSSLLASDGHSVYAVGAEPHGVTGATMVLESVTMSKSLFSLGCLVAAVHGGALGMSIVSASAAAASAVCESEL